jgi:hypothetical protein
MTCRRTHRIQVSDFMGAARASSKRRRAPMKAHEVKYSGFVYYMSACMTHEAMNSETTYSGQKEELLISVVSSLCLEKVSCIGRCHSWHSPRPPLSRCGISSALLGRPTSHHSPRFSCLKEGSKPEIRVPLLSASRLVHHAELEALRVSKFQGLRKAAADQMHDFEPS